MTIVERLRALGEDMGASDYVREELAAIRAEVEAEAANLSYMASEADYIRSERVLEYAARLGAPEGK